MADGTMRALCARVCSYVYVRMCRCVEMRLGSGVSGAHPPGNATRY